MEDTIEAEFINLPKPKFIMGKEPNRKFVKINQFSNFSDLQQVEDILGTEEFARVKDSFLGPVLKFHSNGKMMMSAKILHCILTRRLVTRKKKELLFHFGGQPMRFSIGEFHLVTGLNCKEWTQEHEEREKKWDWGELQDNHSSDDVIELMIKARRTSYDERLSLGMLVLIENIYLHRYSAAKYPREYLERASSLEMMMNYPWGIDAYELLLESVDKLTKEKLSKNSYDIHGFPIALHLWILESIPKLQSAFSTIDNQVPATAFLCEKYKALKNPVIEEVLWIEGNEDLHVVCVLPKIPTMLRTMSIWKTQLMKMLTHY
ncbi:hypothetical protein V5N11_028462 [Cardamine amara subsp. amara]|uniref:DUF1985 domain-containing protein n=1 Tax=Cardamine amara subsp. amara TaxID=228776 RepID=A0ABD1BP66_CARAN